MHTFCKLIFLKFLEKSNTKISYLPFRCLSNPSSDYSTLFSVNVPGTLCCHFFYSRHIINPTSSANAVFALPIDATNFCCIIRHCSTHRFVNVEQFATNGSNKQYKNGTTNNKYDDNGNLWQQLQQFDEQQQNAEPPTNSWWGFWEETG